MMYSLKKADGGSRTRLTLGREASPFCRTVVEKLVQYALDHGWIRSRPTEEDLYAGVLFDAEFWTTEAADSACRMLARAEQT